MKSLALLLGIIVAQPASAQLADAPSCNRGFFVSSGAHGLNTPSTTRVIAGVQGGAQLSVRVIFRPGDNDSKSTELWFLPVAVTILDDVVYAESAPLKWPPSTFSWTNDDTAVGAISLRVASNGELASVQGDESARAEPIETAWCLR